MVDEKPCVSDRTIGHEKSDYLSNLFTVSAILESLSMLLTHYTNDLGDDTGHCWHGLGLILNGVRQTIDCARDGIDTEVRTK